jgi:hypothetical protein
MPAKPRPKKKVMTLEHLATAIQQDFLAIRRDMATKNDLQRLRTEMATKAEVREIRDDVKRITEVMVSKADLANTIREELDKSPFAKETDVAELRARMARVEEKLGLRRRQPAA